MSFGVLFVFEVICGLGIGVVFPVSTVLVQNLVPMHEMANAYSAYSFTQTVSSRDLLAEY